MSKTLITGGAGFIGSHVVDRLAEAGRQVRVLDSLEPQVHGEGAGHRNDAAEYVEGSVMDAATIDRALDGVDEVVHLAAQVGVGQSTYEMARYVGENCVGTALLLERMAEVRDQIRTLVSASSMSIYGEGQYSCESCGTADATVARALEDLEARRWEVRCTACGGDVTPLPTSERKRLEPDSIYAITKRDQEELSLVFGRSYGVRTVALRFFNVYGPRQSLSNPYTGVAAIFSSRLLAGNRPLVFEDGLQSRDFIHVSDIVQAVERSLDSEGVGDVALNVGTGAQTTVLGVAKVLSEELGVELEPEVVSRFRHGDVRHCYADISRIRELLGYEPAVAFRDGMRELVGWIKEDAPPSEDRVAQATDELERRGLVV
jgi:dTDP-L-rhamnose 4-epimerase